MQRRTEFYYSSPAFCCVDRKWVLALQLKPLCLNKSTLELFTVHQGTYQCLQFRKVPKNMYNFRQANSAIDFSEISHVSKMMSDKIWGITSFTAELIIEEQTHKLSVTQMLLKIWNGSKKLLSWKKLLMSLNPLHLISETVWKKGRSILVVPRGVLAWEGVTIAFIYKRGRERW